MTVDLKLRYVVDQRSKLLALVAPDGTLHSLATVSLDTTRAMPDAEAAWRSILGCAIESAALAAETDPCRP